MGIQHQPRYLTRRSIVNDERIKQAVEKVGLSFSKNMMFIYAATKTIRDSLGEAINRGINDPSKRDQMKKYWSSLNDFCRSFDDYLKSRGIE